MHAFSVSQQEHSMSDTASRSQPTSRIHRFWREQIRPLMIMLIILTAVRSSLADWNDVPSQSMEPTILRGDRIFVTKAAYSLRIPLTQIHLVRWAMPQRGDVVVFIEPTKDIRMVKRVVGVPGDLVEVHDGRVIINGEAAAITQQPANAFAPRDLSDPPPYEFATEQLGQGSHDVMALPWRPSLLRNTKPMTVPTGHVLVMGDNRDNSNDSRAYGCIPLECIVGRADGIAFSFDPKRGSSPRWSRFFSRLDD
jgi:signal peptidase I